MKFAHVSCRLTQARLALAGSGSGHGVKADPPGVSFIKTCSRRPGTRVRGNGQRPEVAAPCREMMAQERPTSRMIVSMLNDRRSSRASVVMYSRLNRISPENLLVR